MPEKGLRVSRTSSGRNREPLPSLQLPANADTGRAEDYLPRSSLDGGHVADRTRDGIGNAQLLLGHHSPAVTAQHYLGFTRSRYAEIREALRFGLAPTNTPKVSGALDQLADLVKRGAPVGAPSATGFGRAKPRGKNQQRPQALPKRAIQESNLWPLAPEANALSS